MTSFCKSTPKEKTHTDGLDVLLSNPHLSFAAGFGTTLTQVAGFHRAVPSTALDKASMQFGFIIRILTKKSIFFSKGFSVFGLSKNWNVYNLVMDFSCKREYHIPILLRS